MEIEDLIIGDIYVAGFVRFLYVDLVSLWVLIVDSDTESVLVHL